MNTIYRTFSKGNRGYTLLFAVLISSLVLAIGISILTISRKEFLISTSTRDSTSALFAADSGIECAIFGDDGEINGARRNAFDPAGDRTSLLGCNVPHSDIVHTVVDPAPQTRTDTFVFHAKFSTYGDSCAVVTVTKKVVTQNGNPRTFTTIESRGYNTGWRKALPGQPDVGPCDIASAKRVERGLSYSTF